MESDERHFLHPFELFNNFLYVLENYGWYFLIATAVFLYFYSKVLKEYWESYKKSRDEREYAAKYHKNPDLFQQRQKSQENYVKKLQEKYEQDAEEYQKKLEELKARKKEEQLEKYKVLSGIQLGSGDKSEKKTKSFKPEYHPLMGGASSSNYKPPKRSACGGGGCGGGGCG